MLVSRKEGKQERFFRRFKFPPHFNVLLLSDSSQFQLQNHYRNKRLQILLRYLHSKVLKVF